MKKSRFVFFIGFLFLANAVLAQSAADTSHTMIMPDAATVYLDEQGKPVDAAAFMKKMTGGGYKLEPTIERCRRKELRLTSAGVDLRPGTEAPDFTVSDLHGRVYHLRELTGKAVVLNFWFTSCAGCVAEMPQLNE